MEKQVGIWMDSDKAFIIDNNEGTVTKIDSEVEHFHLHGGAGGKTPYAEQDATSETKLLERKKHQFKSYYNNLFQQISGADKVVVFGPAEAKVGFQKEFEQNNTIKAELVGVETTDSNFSENQLKEWVRNYFSA